MMSPIYIHAYDGVCALGCGAEHMQNKLFSRTYPTDGVSSTAYAPASKMLLGLTPQGCTDSNALPSEIPLPFRSANNALIYQAFQKIQSAWMRVGANVPAHRVAVILGSSNSGIAQGEQAVSTLHSTNHFPDNYVYEQQEYGSPSLFLSWLLGATGPAYTLSTACSSSAKAFISGARLLQQNLCDVAIVGGADVVSQLTAQGFLSLEAVDGGRCQPFASQRQGIHLGEAAALFILSREPSGIRLSGWGEASDAHHIAAPHPQGEGAKQSMQKALSHAHLTPGEIDYLNLHGTATQQNDAMEAQAVAQVFAHTGLKVSSTKPLTGHTLGAAGAIEALFSCMTLSQSTDGAYQLPAHWIRGSIDPSLPKLNYVFAGENDQTPRLKHIMSNSFGFGGSNASLIFSKVDS